MRKVLADRSGQGTLEYVLVLVIILLAIIIGGPLIKTAVSGDMFNASKGRIETAAARMKALP